MREYVLSIIAAALLSTVVKALIGEKNVTGKIAALLCSVLVAVTLIAPLKNIRFQNITSYLSELNSDADNYIRQGVSAADKSIADIIKSQAEAYILDKADQMGLCITVEVELDETNDNIPDRVTIQGNVSPYTKEVFSNFLQEELGIEKGKQQWN